MGLLLVARNTPLVQASAAMDTIDDKILRELTADGRITNAELAQRVALSPSACLRRVQELERLGVITGYRAVLDAARLGMGFLAYVAVGLSRHALAEQQGFEQAMAACPAVRECHNVTGSFEYLLRVEVADLPAYKRFHADVLGALSQVATITSYIVMASTKDERG
jgi:Lrp/AsnC family transcriptional regulator, leucine-responsive regulatory protein